MPTPADQLREAATLIRERALIATPGPWSADQSEVYRDHAGGYWVAETLNTDGDDITEANSAHIASWHPTVALAVAVLLDSAATAWPIDHSEPPRNPRDRQMAYAAINVARAYLDTTEQVTA